MILNPDTISLSPPSGQKVNRAKPVFYEEKDCIFTPILFRILSLSLDRERGARG
jgi:hypothetical protein